MLRTYSKKKTKPEESRDALPPLSPPKKKSVWAGFGLKRRQPPRAAAAALEYDEDGEDEEEEQACLALGQQPMRDCAYCRMRFCRGVSSEETLHTRYCKRFRFGQKWSGACTAVQHYADGTRVVVVPRADEQREDSAARRVMEVVDLELGFSESEAPGEGNGQQALLVLLRDRRAVAAAVLVPVARAYRVDCEHSRDGIVQCAAEPEPAALGVSRLWVHRDHRRQHYAQRLLDCAAAHWAVAPASMAFSQPTELGRRVAAKWFGREDFLVFKE
jgi:hypothetical protein